MLFAAVAGILNEYAGDPITIRHLFYRLAGAGVIAKDERAYGHIVAHLGKWRIDGSIPFNRFVDGTRWHYGVDTFDDAAAALDEAVRSYRKNLWRVQDYYLEIWCEKEAIAGLVKPVANQWGLQVFVCRGFNSLSASAAAAAQFQAAIEQNKQPVILYLGDHDASGVLIDKSLMKHFSYFPLGLGVDNEGKDVRLTVADFVALVRVAILPEQIAEYDLPNRPPKPSSHSAGWGEADCVEIDTLSGAQIRALLEAHIKAHIDPGRWERTQAIEEAEKATLARAAVRFKRGAGRRHREGEK